MALDKKLYNALYNLRQKIKDEARSRGERAPLVCTDEALEEMAELCPKKISDFEGVSGIGKAFIENYGDQFLGVILKNTAEENERGIGISQKTLETLRELEKKLVSINRRNRLLYAPKTSSRHTYDLFLCGQEICDKIIYGSGSACICSFDGLSGADCADEKAKYKKIVSILREANKDLREKGQNNLYIGYPFVIGMLPGEDFTVRAPLALFPVSAERTATDITLSLDDERDIIYNTTLILANYKFNGISEPLPTDTIETFSKGSFFGELCAFYAEHGLKIAEGNVTYTKFTEYTQATFPTFAPGELHTEACAVLGRFPICGSSIQKDFDEIIKANKINSLLGSLLAEGEETDFYADEEKEPQTAAEASEQSLVYINDMNSSQEAVLSACENGDRLVVQGPPGTGKSQTITSLISEFVIKGKTVLMVSEKKTALDVVYSRLGKLSKYALIIDDVGNKNAFYNQLSDMVMLGREKSGTAKNLTAASAGIDNIINKFEAIAKRLYEPDESGIEPYRLYLMVPRVNMNDTETRKRFIAIKNNRAASLSNAPFEVIDKAHALFMSDTKNAALEDFHSRKTSFPWLASVREGLGDYEIMELEQELCTYRDEKERWKGKNIFARLFTKGALMRRARELAEKYFVSASKEICELIFKNPDELSRGIESYIPYCANKPLYDGLSEGEREYLESVVRIKNARGISFEEAGDELFFELVYERISKFEAQNRDIIADIDNFDESIRAVSRAMSEKKALTREILEEILAGDMYNLATSKRRGEILRVLESKRKWSVNKFIKKFDFEIFKSVRIWLLTPEVVSEIIPLQTGLFDLVVFDEASQMYVEKGLPSILRAKKVVIAGDHKQLRPSSLGAGRLESDTEELAEDEELAAALEEESLLDLARFKYDDVMLNFHYRSKYEELIAFSNYAFYRGRLYVSPNATLPSEPPIEVHRMEDALWKNRTNEKEAQFTVSLLKEFFATRREDETVGIITFNSDQRDLIEDLIDDECAKDSDFADLIRRETVRRRDGEDIGLFVKNIESVQGDERDVIIFSVGYAKNEQGKLVRNFGWLNQRGGENRLNVAISRAKKKVHILTSFDPSELEVDDMKNEGPKILRKYLEYSAAVSSGNREAARDILLSLSSSADEAVAHGGISFLARELSEQIMQKGYEVDFNVGIGGYTIDLAVKYNGRYVLGIECDGQLYEKSKKTRERDYHRQKYLEARGWKIYRAWSRNWWYDKQGEIDKICKAIEEE